MTQTQTIPDDGAMARIDGAHWALRIALASVFVFHGVSKFGSLQAGADQMGLSVEIWTLVALAEIGCPILILLGGTLAGRMGDMATRLGAVGLIPVMIGAIAMVHWGRWSFVATEAYPMGGMEFQVTLLLVSLYLALRGNAA